MYILMLFWCISLVRVVRTLFLWLYFSAVLRYCHHISVLCHRTLLLLLLHDTTLPRTEKKQKDEERPCETWRSPGCWYFKGIGIENSDSIV